MDVSPSVQTEESWCPSCNAGLADESQRCTSCGYSLAGLRVYNPKHFIWLAFLFSAMVPIYLAASNWGKIGRTRTKRLWLGLGFVGFALMFTSLLYYETLAASVANSLAPPLTCRSATCSATSTLRCIAQR